MNECINYCPCQHGCPNGCSDCPSVFCQCRPDADVPGLVECEELGHLLERVPGIFGPSLAIRSE